MLERQRRGIGYRIAILGLTQTIEADVWFEPVVVIETIGAEITLRREAVYKVSTL